MAFSQYYMEYDTDCITLVSPIKRRKLAHISNVTQGMTPASHNPFNKLAIEITQSIASFLEYDQDICNFQLISKSARAAIEGDNCTFWRRRFLEKFEKPNWTEASNSRYKAEYQKRRFLLKNGAVFKSGSKAREKQCLELLAHLVTESHSGRTDRNSFIYECKNVEHIKRFLRANNILQIIGEPLRKGTDHDIGRKHKCKRNSDPQPATVRPTPTTLLQAIQIIAAPMLLSFEPHIISHHFGFPDSQRAVYSCPKEVPILGGYNGVDINIPFILHNLNFWKYHMIRDVETTLYYPFCDLDEHHRPQWWTSQPKGNEQKLATRWKGSYAYVDREEIDAIRMGDAEAWEIQDHFAGEDTAFTFQDMTLSLVSEEEAGPWPEIFELHLRALTPRSSTGPKTRAQKLCASPDAVSDEKRLNFRFQGEGQDVSEVFPTSGWMESLPAQHGMPGWSRVKMMKYFEDDYGNIDTEALWAYEGVMLPGGKIMLGRWWSVADGEQAMYSGPFILWAVDEGA